MNVCAHTFISRAELRIIKVAVEQWGEKESSGHGIRILSLNSATVTYALSGFGLFLTSYIVSPSSLMRAMY